MKITYLLNPLCGDRDDHRNPESPTPTSHPVTAVPAPRRQKMPKDAPIFSQGHKPVGIVNFLPHEAGNDKELLAQHRKLKVYPSGDIFEQGVRRIPYNSDKKDFLDKTGRDAFEVFHYKYKVPGDEKEYVVVWDYNVGLVRMTPFFKSCKYAKTIPAKALKENPGLKDISYSITGGALICQGYWMPYYAARALAATFCYDIRWALTPVFGNDFPFLCLKPDDPGFGRFVIDPNLVQYCAHETTRFRELGPAYEVRRPATLLRIEAAKLRPRQLQLNAQVASQQRVRPTDTESGYGSDTDQSEKYLDSPGVSPRTRFTPINRLVSPYPPRAAEPPLISSPVSMHAQPGLLTPTYTPYLYPSQGFRPKRSYSNVAWGEHSIDDAATRPPTAATIDSAHGSEMCSGGDENRSHAEMDVAEMLLSLRTADNTMPPSKRTRRDSTW